jgi:hypothetical protein
MSDESPLTYRFTDDVLRQLLIDAVRAGQKVPEGDEINVTMLDSVAMTFRVSHRPTESTAAVIGIRR